MRRVHLPAVPPPPLSGTVPVCPDTWVKRSRRRVLYATSAGLLQETRGGLQRLVPRDVKPVQLLVAGAEALADESTLDVGEKVWRLPPEHVALVFEEYVFSPRPMAPVRLVYAVLNGKSHNVYFEVDTGTDASTLDEDAQALLTGLKSCPAYTACSEPSLVLSS